MSCLMPALISIMACLMPALISINGSVHPTVCRSKPAQVSSRLSPDCNCSPAALTPAEPSRGALDAVLHLSTDQSSVARPSARDVSTRPSTSVLTSHPRRMLSPPGGSAVKCFCRGLDALQDVCCPTFRLLFLCLDSVPGHRAQRQDLLPLLIKLFRFGRYRNVGDTLRLDLFDCHYCCFDLVCFWSLSNILFIFRDLGRVPFLPTKLLCPSVLASSSTRSEF